jgi:hypothetical protein
LGCALVSAVVVLVGLDVTSGQSWLFAVVGAAMGQGMGLLGIAGGWVYAHGRLLVGPTVFAYLFLWCCAWKESERGNSETRFWQGFGVALVVAEVMGVLWLVGESSV